MRVFQLLVVSIICLGSVAAAPVAMDDEGDHEVSAQGVPLTGARWDSLDLVALDIEELPEGFAFTLQVAELAAPGENLLLIDGIDWFVHYEYRGAQYRINFFQVGSAPLADGYFYGATLDRFDPGTGRWDLEEHFPVTVDAAAGTIGTTIPRARIVGADGAGALKGEPIEGIHVTSALFMEQVTLVNTPAGALEYPVQGSDAMPDDGLLSIVIEQGIDQDGTARLSSPAPVRVSNGEATTMLFQVRAENRADEQQLFAFEAKDVPDAWTVTLPQERIRLDGKEAIDVPVLVTTPFNHQHGAFEQMLLEMQSQQDTTATGRIELGIRYTEVPQPAGHHDRMYIHIPDAGEPFFNTLEEDPADGGTEATARSSCACNGESIARYNIPLLPGLLMGLDFDMDRTGIIEVPIRFDSPANGVRVYGEIGVYEGTDGRREGFFNDENERAVATIAASDTMDFQAGETRLVTMEIKPSPFGDYLPYEQDNAMVLHLDIAVPAMTPMCCLVEPHGILEAGGWMQLPLDEYHDDVSDYFSSLTGVEMYAQGAQEALVNPGETILFNATIDNLGETGGKYDLSLTGNNVEWARVLGSSSIEVAAGASRPLVIAVTAPADARDGEQADVILHAVSVDDDNVRTLIRYLAEVDDEVDHSDASEVLDGLDAELTDKQSPGLGLPLLLAAIVLARRRA